MTLTQERQLILLKPEGGINLEFGTALSEQIATIEPRCNQLWVIDLAEVDFMDSSGLVPLIKGLMSARQSGCRLVLCNVQPQVKLILELTQLDSVFEIVPKYEDIICDTPGKSLAFTS
ncbi:STAS domain-containing protein [Anabaena sp. FACHB-1237]|uniref:STAS domain-containing protein n=1 Tax=Anabaena sp. FACHB-1237 TaxID=2692769 RepID=UPI0016813581|nr:STAS domain-containing protein [Anabaena sp. FACHB-1237]MBD2137232.1 STAS domain-containing protein [Anabaena sp. FACHB-1237]